MRQRSRPTVVLITIFLVIIVVSALLSTLSLLSVTKWRWYPRGLKRARRMADPNAPHRILARAKKTLLNPVTEACAGLQCMRKDLQSTLPSQQDLLESRRSGRPLMRQVTAIRKVEQMLDVDEESLFLTEERFEEMYAQLDVLQEKSSTDQYGNVFEERLPQLRASLQSKFGIVSRSALPVPDTRSVLRQEPAAPTLVQPPGPAPPGGHATNGTMYLSERELRTESPPSLAPVPSSASKISWSLQTKLKRFVSSNEKSAQSSPLPQHNHSRQGLANGVSKIPFLSPAQKAPQPAAGPFLSSAQKAPQPSSITFPPSLAASPPDSLSSKLRTPSKMGSNRRPFTGRSGSKMFSATKLNTSFGQSASKTSNSSFVPNPIATQNPGPLSVPSSSGQTQPLPDVGQPLGFRTQLDVMTERINQLRAEIRSRKQ